MVKRLRLPNASPASQCFVDCMGRCALDPIHDLSEGTHFHRVMVDQGCEDDMHVIGHNHGNPKIEFVSVIVQTAAERDGTHRFRKNPSTISAECNKVLPVINLKMRQLPPVKRLWHKGSKFYVGTAALGCPRSAAPRFLILVPHLSVVEGFRRDRTENVPTREFPHYRQRTRRASLARTAEGGCPHMISSSEDRLPMDGELLCGPVFPLSLNASWEYQRPTFEG
jgi:hypothetical protein